jgi:outer membrane biosynthesis protein TonB
MDVTDGGKPYLKLRVETIELLKNVSDASFSPPSNAAGPLGERVSGVNIVPMNTSSNPKWPSSLSGQHFVIKLKIVVGKDGHVISAQAISGPPEAYKACEDAVRKWTFKPYLVLGKPVEVEQNLEFTQY